MNLNEEYVSLSQYQEQYQASARIINVASTMFDTLLACGLSEADARHTISNR